jgi:hypothetical protein
MSYELFCIGNPLLDMQVTKGEALLAKYDLKANDAILAEEKHDPMCVLVAHSLNLNLNDSTAMASWSRSTRLPMLQEVPLKMLPAALP